MALVAQLVEQSSNKGMVVGPSPTKVSPEFILQSSVSLVNKLKYEFRLGVSMSFIMCTSTIYEENLGLNALAPHHSLTAHPDFKRTGTNF